MMNIRPHAPGSHQRKNKREKVAALSNQTWEGLRGLFPQFVSPPYIRIEHW